MKSKQSLEAILSTLVAFDTTSRNSNLECMAYIQDYLRDYNVSSELIYNEEKSKANLFARIGPDVAEGIVLSGHSDVVPVDGQDWETDPFVLEKQGRHYIGRGTADMKSFLAVVLYMVPRFVEAPLKEPVYIAFSYDEEVGCCGVPSLIEHIVTWAKQPKLVIIGEPTTMEVVTAHKSIQGFRTTINGFACHSSNAHEGVNAILVAADLIQQLQEIVSTLSGSEDKRFIPPFTSLNIGEIKGGAALNIVAEHCYFDWEIRAMPGVNVEAIVEAFKHFCKKKEQTMKVKSPTCNIMVESLCAAPALADQCQDEVKNTVMKWAQKNHSSYVSFATEAGLFQQAAIPAIVCGPGSIEQAHKPNEFIDEKQLQLCVDFMIRLQNHLV